MALKLKTKQQQLPVTVLSALGQSKKKKIQDASVKKLIGDATFDKCNGLFPKLWVRSTVALFAVTLEAGDTYTKITLDPNDSPEYNANLIATSIKNAVEELTGGNIPQHENVPIKKVTPKNVHAAIEADMSNSGAVSLPDAEHWYQPTLSTGSGSRYSFIAKHKSGAKLAIRLRTGNASVRMEPCPEVVQKQSNLLGLSYHGGYASAHFEVPNDVVLARYVAMLNGVLDTWDVAPFNEKKIREVSK